MRIYAFPLRDDGNETEIALVGAGVAIVTFFAPEISAFVIANPIATAEIMGDLISPALPASTSIGQMWYMWDNRDNFARTH